jgi:hypothetical protein
VNANELRNRFNVCPAEPDVLGAGPIFPIHRSSSSTVDDDDSWWSGRVRNGRTSKRKWRRLQLRPLWNDGLRSWECHCWWYHVCRWCCDARWFGNWWRSWDDELNHCYAEPDDDDYDDINRDDYDDDDVVDAAIINDTRYICRGQEWVACRR